MPMRVGSRPHKASHTSGGSDAFQPNDTLDCLSRVAIKKDDTLVGKRRALNLHQGSNVTLTVTDDSENEEVDVTIAATGAGAPIDASYVTINAEPELTAEVQHANITDQAQLHICKYHNTTHQHGGSDEINVTGLSGELADPQTPKAHKASHTSGGSDAFQPNDILDCLARLEIKKEGVSVGKRRGLNLHQGSNVTLTVTDDSENEEVDVTIAAAAGGGGTYKLMPDFTVYKVGTTFYTMDSDGNIVYSGSSLESAIQTAANTGGFIYVKPMVATGSGGTVHFTVEGTRFEGAGRQSTFFNNIYISVENEGMTLKNFSIRTDYPSQDIIAIGTTRTGRTGRITVEDVEVFAAGTIPSGVYLVHIRNPEQGLLRRCRIDMYTGQAPWGADAANVRVYANGYSSSQSIEDCEVSSLWDNTQTFRGACILVEAVNNDMGFSIGGCHLYSGSSDSAYYESYGVHVKAATARYAMGGISGNVFENVRAVWTSGDYSKKIVIENNDMGYRSSQSYPAIYLNYASGKSKVIGNIYGDGNTYPLKVDVVYGPEAVLVEGNKFASGSTFQFPDNVAFIWGLGNYIGATPCEGGWYGTIPSGSNSVTWNHGMPDRRLVTVLLTGMHQEVTDLYVSSVTDTQITVAVPSNVTANRRFYHYIRWAPVPFNWLPW
jgi:hypothetical protein